jgi:TPR repeat protein
MGNTEAKYMYSHAHFNFTIPGLARKESLLVGRQLLRECAEAGLAEAQYAYAVNSIANKDTQTALKYIHLAAAQKHTMAMYQLANWFNNGTLPRDDQKAFKYMLQAHDAGLVEATFLLAGFYAKGTGGAVDTSKSIDLYKQASSKGFRV